MTVIFTDDPENEDGSDAEFWGEDVIEDDNALGIFDIAGMSANILSGNVTPKYVATLRVEDDRSEGS